MEHPTMQCETTASLKDNTGFGPTFRCEAQRGHKGHHHFQVQAKIHRPAEVCRCCEAVKPEKYVDQKVQVSFWIAP